MSTMNMIQIISALQDIFNEPLKDGEQRKIVFWVDKDQEFVEEIDQLIIDGVKVQTLSENNQFYLKHLLEEEDSSSPYLIYTTLELGLEDNWLADTVYYSKTFYADRISLIISELQIDPSLRGVIKKYERFFHNKERYRKFQGLSIESYSEEMIELAIMSVLCNVKVPDFEEVLKTILMDTLEDGDNRFLTQMDKFFDEEVFWKYVFKQYGYERDTKTLKTLFIHMAITAFSHSVNEQYLTSVKDFIAVRNRTNCLVFIDHWMHHKTDDGVFDEYVEMAEKEIQLPQVLQTVPIEELKKQKHFPISTERSLYILPIAYLRNSKIMKSTRN